MYVCNIGQLVIEKGKNKKTEQGHFNRWSISKEAMVPRAQLAGSGAGGRGEEPIESEEVEISS